MPGRRASMLLLGVALMGSGGVSAQSSPTVVVPTAASTAAPAVAPAVAPRASPADDAAADAPARGPTRATIFSRAATPNYRLVIEAPAELIEALQTRTLLGRWRDDPDFSVEQLPLFVERGPEEAVAIAIAAGFFSATAQVFLLPATPGPAQAAPSGSPVGDQVVAGASAQPPTVRIVIDAGARTTVSAFALRLQGAASGLPIERRLNADWLLPAGSFFRTTEWELGKRLLIEQLQADGYLRAKVTDSRARVDAQLTAATLAITIDSGPRLNFGPLVIRGLSRYPRTIVEDLRPFREGDPYSLDAALLFQQRLRATGQFAAATVLPDLGALENNEQAAAVPVIVELSERQTQRFTGGIGYSTDQGLRALVGYEHRNLRDRGWVLESGLLLEALRSRAFAILRTPQDSAGHYWQAGLRSERLDTLGEFTQTQTVYLGRGKRSEAIENFISLQYQTERGEVDLGSGLESRDRRSALSLGWAWSMRRLDSRVDPREGFTISTQVSAALKGVGSDRSFARLYGRAMRFWPMSVDGALAGGTLIGLAEAGWVLSTDREDIPSQNLFRAGGAQSVRGYRFLGLGLSQGDAIVGGRVLALGSLEYQHPVSGNWYGAAFVDVGNVVDEITQWRPAVGFGVGARWRSPIGPVNLDLAYGERDRRVRAHFSVGYSF